MRRDKEVDRERERREEINFFRQSLTDRQSERETKETVGERASDSSSEFMLIGNLAKLSESFLIGTWHL